jgi:hypothetical protein
MTAERDRVQRQSTSRPWRRSVSAASAAVTAVSILEPAPARSANITRFMMRFGQQLGCSGMMGCCASAVSRRALAVDLSLFRARVHLTRRFETFFTADYRRRKRTASLAR